MRRSLFLALPGLASASVFFAGVGVAHAEPPKQGPPAKDATAAQPITPPSSDSTIGGLHILATGGIGASMNEVRHLDLAPYGGSLGLDAGYTFSFGFHLGAYFGYSFGRTTMATHDPIIGAPLDYTADASSLNAGIAVGYDLPLHFLVLRYTLGLGVTSMSFDFGGIDPRRLRFDDVSNPSVGFHFAPGAALLWPYGLFEGGIGFDYLIQVDATLPSGFLGKLLAGVRL
jgi:hypothetical protein